MILDQLKHADSYSGLGERFAKGFAFLRRGGLGELAAGRHEIDGDDVYALVMEVELKPMEEGFWEAHRRYADIQYVVSGVERMGVTDISTLKTSKAYDAKGDAELFAGSGQSVLVQGGCFAVFLPQDGHMPGLRPGAEAAKVKKVVVKVRVAKE
jgi:YhcH/YjgK/YiaL family protein